jgi:hypothetical protein
MRPKPKPGFLLVARREWRWLLHDRSTIFGRRRQYQVGGVQPIEHQNDGEPVHDGEVRRNVGCCRDDPEALVKIAAKLPGIAIEVDVVEDQYGIGR